MKRKSKQTLKELLGSSFEYQPISCAKPSGYLLAYYISTTSKLKTELGR